MSLGENTVIFSVTNGKNRYPELAVLWAKFLDKLNINNYIIYCIDKESFDYLNEQGVRCQLVKKKPQIEDKPFSGAVLGLDKNDAFRNATSKFGLIGAYKFMIAKDLLKQGKDVVYSDTDAFFCRDPVPHLRDLLGQYDCLLSTAVLGVSHPQKILKQIGFTACSGFLALKAGKGSIDFISDMESRLSEYGDLQRAINFYLLPYIQKLRLPLEERRDSAFRVEGFHIKMLPQSFVRRERVVKDDISPLYPCVFHCLGATPRCLERGAELYKKLYG